LAVIQYFHVTLIGENCNDIERSADFIGKKYASVESCKDLKEMDNEEIVDIIDRLIWNKKFESIRLKLLKCLRIFCRRGFFLFFFYFFLDMNKDYYSTNEHIKKLIKFLNNEIHFVEPNIPLILEIFSVFINLSGNGMEQYLK
jgi:hypothetical protein